MSKLEDLQSLVPEPRREPQVNRRLEDVAKADSSLAGLARGAVESSAEAFDQVARDSKTGLFTSIGGLDNTTANVFMVMDGAADRLASITGTTKGGAFEALEDYYRREARQFALNAAEAGGGNSFGSKVTQTIAGLPVGLAQAGAAVAVAGPVAGFAGLGALSEADRGFVEAGKAAVAGAFIGKVFQASAGMTPVGRFGVVAPAEAGSSLARGESVEDAVLAGTTVGTLAALGGKRPPKVQEVTLDQLRKTERASVVEEARVQIAEEKAARTRAAAVADEPAVSFKPIARAEAAEAGALLNPENAEGGIINDRAPDRVINLNLRRIQGPEDFKRAQAELTEFFEPRIQEARRGSIRLEETQRLADDLGMTVEQLAARRKGQAFNAEEITAARVLHQSVTQELLVAAKRVREGVASDADKAEFTRLISMFDASSSNMLGATAEAGRALSALRIEAGPKAAEIRRVRDTVRGFKEQTGQDIDTFADLLRGVETGGELRRVVESVRKPTKGDQFIRVWMDALLSGPQTQTVNLASNTAVALWTIPEAYVGGTVGALRSGSAALRGRPAPERVFLSEGNARLVGLVEGARDGFKMMGRAFLEGESSFDNANKVELPGRTKPLFFGRLLVAGDELFKNIGYRQEIQAQATRLAALEGRRGRGYYERKAELLNDPPEFMRRAALEQARVQTFTNELGKVGQAVLDFSNAHPAVKINAPFVRTPTNIFKWPLKRLPFPIFSEVKANLAKGGAARDAELGRIGAATGMAMAIGAMAAEGNITGSGPANPELRRLWLQQNQPYSFRLGKGRPWTSLARLEPLGTMLAVADFFEVAGHAKEGELDEAAAQLVLSFRKNVENKTFLKGFTGLMLATSDFDRYGERFKRDLLGTVVPTGVAQVARTQDPVLRSVDSVTDKIKSRVPDYSTELPPRRNVWGDPILLNPGIGPDIISPFYQMSPRPDRATEEAFRVKAKLRPPDKNMRGIRLTAQEHSDLQKLAGQPAKRAIDAFVASPGYSALPDGVKKETMERIYQRTRAHAETELFLSILQEQPGRALKPAQDAIKVLLK